MGTNWPVVSMVYEKGYDFGDIEIVFDQEKPKNHDAIWDVNQSDFAPSSDFGGYAERNPRIADCVRLLKKGRYYLK